MNYMKLLQIVIKYLNQSQSSQLPKKVSDDSKFVDYALFLMEMIKGSSIDMTLLMDEVDQSQNKNDEKERRLE